VGRIVGDEGIVGGDGGVLGGDGGVHGDDGGGVVSLSTLSVRSMT
jgi:hypothetical protein